MRTEKYAHEEFYLPLMNSRDVIDNKSSSLSSPISPPPPSSSLLKDCHSPPLLTSMLPPLQHHLHQQQQQHLHQSPQAPSFLATFTSPTCFDIMPPSSRTEPDSGAATTDGLSGAALNHEEVRRKTFTASWPHAHLDVGLLAATGFYYIGPNDNVKCYFCKVEIGRWERDDHEVSEHQRWSQNCPMLRRRTTTNVPLDAALLDRVLPPVTIDVCGPGGGVDVRHNTISEGSFDVQQASMPAAVPVVVTSASSAHNLSQDLGPDMHFHSMMATAGVNSVSAAAAQQLVHEHQSGLQEQQQQQQQQQQLQPMHSVPAIRYPDHPEYAIESARLRSFDDWPKTMKQKPKELSDAGFFYTMKGDRVKCFSCGGGLRDWDENDVPWEQHAQWFGHCQYLQLIKGPEYVEEVLRQANAAKSESGAAQAQPSAVAAAAAEAAAAAAEATAAAEELSGPGGRKICDTKLCKICYSCEYNTAFLPCGHVVACAKCASSVTKCPMCRKPFERVMRVYFS